MPTLDSIHNQEQKLIGAFIKQFDGEIKRVFESAKRLAQARMSSIKTDDILRFELIWRDILRDAGYYNLINGLIDDQFNKIFSGTLKSFDAGGLATAFTKDDASKIQILKQMKRDYFNRIADDVGLEVKRQLYKYAIADASLDTMTLGIEQALAGSNLAKYSQTYARTSIKDFQQEVIDLRATDIDDGVWVYVGVQDDQTRDFCQTVLDNNSCYSDGEKDELEGNPERSWNCRHRFYYMLKEEAIANGYACNQNA